MVISSIAKLVEKHFFTKTLIAVLLSNISCVVVFNLLELPTLNLVFIFPAFVSVYSYAVSKSIQKRARVGVQASSIKLILPFLILLNLPRFLYLYEWFSITTVFPLGDDAHRLAELTSMTLSERYPLVHYANQHYLFSFYYAALIPFAFLKKLVLLLTLKDVIFILNLFYSVFIVFSLLEVSHFLLGHKKSILVFMFLCTYFGGFDWVFGLERIVGHYEGWTKDVFNANAQVSSFHTGLFWTTHHFAGMYSLVLAYVVYRYYLLHDQQLKLLIVGLLAVNSFYSSVFAFLPGVLFVLAERGILTRFMKSRVSICLAIIFVVPLFIYTNKLSSQTFTFSRVHVAFTDVFILNRIVSLPIYISLISIVDFAGIPLVLVALYKHFSSKEKAYYWMAGIYSLLTYFIAYSGVNNFCARGMFLPTLVFYLLFSKYYPRLSQHSGTRESKVLILSLALVLSVGTLKEIGDRVRAAGGNIYEARLVFGKEIYESFHTYNLKSIARDSDVRYIQWRNHEEDLTLLYNAEKMLQDVDIGSMSKADRELLRLPRISWIR